MTAGSAGLLADSQTNAHKHVGLSAHDSESRMCNNHVSSEEAGTLALLENIRSALTSQQTLKKLIRSAALTQQSLALIGMLTSFELERRAKFRPEAGRTTKSTSKVHVKVIPNLTV